MKAKYSKKDNRGMIYVDCSECKRGGNGDGKYNCSSGWRTKKGNKGGCFSGELIETITIE